MLVMGNATSGEGLPPSLLPGWLQPLASVMPAGVGVRATDGAWQEEARRLGVMVRYCDDVVILSPTGLRAEQAQ